MPVSALSVTPFQPNSGVVVLPSSTAPAPRMKAVKGASTSQGPSAAMVLDPLRVGQPRVKVRSLIEDGTPSTGPIGRPAIQRASDAFASARALSSSTRT